MQYNESIKSLAADPEQLEQLYQSAVKAGQTDSFRAMLFAVIALMVAATPVSRAHLSPRLATWLRRGILAVAAAGAAGNGRPAHRQRRGAAAGADDGPLGGLSAGAAECGGGRPDGAGDSGVGACIGEDDTG